MPNSDEQHANRDIINIEENNGTVSVTTYLPPPRNRDEQNLLRSVKKEVNVRLAGTLHEDIFLNLAKEILPDQVKPLSSVDIKVVLNRSNTIPDDLTIAQVFDSPSIQGKLLILGNPGSGKTTTLLRLAKTLIEKAEKDPNEPIPLLFNLSRWRDEKQLIRDWMVDELTAFFIKIQYNQDDKYI